MTEAQLRKEIAALYELPSCLIEYFNTDKNDNKSIKIVIEKETENLIQKLNTEYFRTPKLNGELPTPALRLERLKSGIKIKKAYFAKKNYNFLRYIVEGNDIFMEVISEAEIKKGICEWAFKKSVNLLPLNKTDDRIRRTVINALDIAKHSITSGIEVRLRYERPGYESVYEAITKAFRQLSIPTKKIKISNVLHNIFDKASPVECEFINTHFKELISQQNKELQKEVLIVKGELIRYYYDHRTYEEESGSLGNSCMRYWNLKHRFDLYCKNNNVELITLINPDTKKLKARAVLWTIHTGEKVIDRIFSIDETSKRKLASYAVSNGIKTFSSINSTIPLYTDLGLVYLENQCKDSQPYLDSMHVRDEYFDTNLNKHFIASNLSERDEIREIITGEVQEKQICKRINNLNVEVKDILKNSKYNSTEKVTWKMTDNLEWKVISNNLLSVLNYKVNKISLKDILQAAVNGYKVSTTDGLKEITNSLNRQKRVELYGIYDDYLYFTQSSGVKEIYIDYNELFKILKTTVIHKEKIKLFSFNYWPEKLTENEVKHITIDGKKTLVPEFVNEIALINLLKLVRDTNTLKSIEITSLKSLLNISKGCKEKCVQKEETGEAYRILQSREQEYRSMGVLTRVKLDLELDTVHKMLHVKTCLIEKDPISGRERKVQDIRFMTIYLNRDAKYGEILKALAGIKKAKAEKPVKSIASKVYESVEESVLKYLRSDWTVHLVT